MDSRPLYIADPEKSAFFVMTEAEFESKSVEEIQGIFQQKHILVTNMHSTPLQFNSRGLSSQTNTLTIVSAWVPCEVYFARLRKKEGS
jgi:hypothetical protein